MEKMYYLPHVMSATWIIVILAVPVVLGLIFSGVLWLTHRGSPEVKRRCIKFLGAGFFVSDLLAVALCVYMLIMVWA